MKVVVESNLLWRRVCVENCSCKVGRSFVFVGRIGYYSKVGGGGWKGDFCKKGGFCCWKFIWDGKVRE